MDQIKFKTGVFQTFTATRSFALGTLNITVAVGAELEFDGTTLDYSGTRHTFPQLRGAVTAGWLVPNQEYEEGNPAYGKPVSAGIKMRPPTDSSGTAKASAAVTLETDERIVMSSAEHAATTRDQNRQSTRKVASVGGAESQDGVEVRTLKTAAGNRAKTTRTVLTAESAGAALREAENVQIQIKPGKGQSSEEMLERMTDAEKEVYLASKASIKARYVDSEPTSTVVATVKTAKTKEAEGMRLTQSVGGGTEIEDLGSGQGLAKAKSSTVVEDGIVFKNTNGPEKLKPQDHPRSAESQKPIMLKDGTVDARLQVAKAICPEFPTSYDFAAPERKKLARLQADFEDRPDVLRAVFAAESDSFKAKLIAEFPQAFQG
jgi:hypothetical protein